MRKFRFFIETGRNEPKPGDVKIPEHLKLLECTFSCDKHTNPEAFADGVFELWKEQNIMNQGVLYYRTEIEEL